jgi:hypothetical protein
MSDQAMPHSPKADTKQLAREQRRARLAAELRSNLRKRKEQGRGRTLQEAPGVHIGPDNGNEQPEAREAVTADRRGPTGEVA